MSENNSQLTISDKIKKYLVPFMSGQILFDELSDSWLRRAGLYECLHGVAVPIRLDENQELTTLSIALGMAQVIGADPEFRYAESYLAAMRKLFGPGMTRILVSEGAKAGSSGDFEQACVWFRAALLLEPLQRDALYLYGRACSDAYGQEGKDEEYVGNFKAQSIEVYEVLTMAHPGDAIGFYHLGYSYLNLGLYLKAKLTWEEFLRLSDKTQDDPSEAPGDTETADAASVSFMAAIPAEEMRNMREEVRERLARLDDPVVIEQGVNRVLSGDYQGGLAILEPYRDSPYHQWWPLWFYLGAAESALGRADAAIADYRRALQLSPSNTDIMRELIALYEATGDFGTAETYQKKIGVVQAGILAEQED
ncbi:MAG: tetratricopeptide repeat protein [Mogibacterium sp.]|nr:tetratricopeptide repeat protein [Mogibacterium sp.]